MDHRRPHDPRRGARRPRGGPGSHARTGRHLRGPDGAQPERHRPDPARAAVRGRDQRPGRRPGGDERQGPAAAGPGVPGRDHQRRRPRTGQQSAQPPRRRRLARALVRPAPRQGQPCTLRQHDRRPARAARGVLAPHQHERRPLRGRRHRRRRPGILHQLLRTLAPGRARPARRRRQRRHPARGTRRRTGLMGPAGHHRQGRRHRAGPERDRPRTALHQHPRPGRLPAGGRGRPVRSRADGGIPRPAPRLAARRRRRHRPAAGRRHPGQRLVMAAGQGAQARAAGPGNLCRRLRGQPGRLLRAAHHSRRARRRHGLPDRDYQHPRRAAHRAGQGAHAGPAHVGAAADPPGHRHLRRPVGGGDRRRGARGRVAGPHAPHGGPLAAPPGGAGGRRRGGDRARHHRAQARRAAHPPPGAPRRPHRPAEPQPAARPPRPGHPRRRAQGPRGGTGLHRPGRLQAGERRTRPQRRRRAAEGSGRAHGPLPAPQRHPGALRRRRIRDPAARHLGRPDGDHAAAGKGARGRHRAGRGRGPGGAGQLQHGRGAVPARRRGRQHPHDERRCGDVPRQGTQGQLPVLRQRDERQRGREAGAARRHARRARGLPRPRLQGRALPVPAAVPAEGRPAYRPPVRGRGPDPLETPGTGHDFAAALHRPGRRERPDRAAGRMGGAHRLRPGRGLARGRAAAPEHLGQRVGPPVRGKAPGRAHRRRPARLQAAAGSAGSRGDRKLDHARPWTRGGQDARTEGHGRVALDRRLRHRLFEPVGAEILPDQPPEDRQEFCQRPGRQPR